MESDSESIAEDELPQAMNEQDDAAVNNPANRNRYKKYLFENCPVPKRTQHRQDHRENLLRPENDRSQSDMSLSENESFGLVQSTQSSINNVDNISMETNKVVDQSIIEVI